MTARTKRILQLAELEADDNKKKSKPKTAVCDQFAIFENNEEADNSQNLAKNVSDPISCIETPLDNSEIENTISDPNPATNSFVLKRKSTVSFLFEKKHKKTFCTFCDSEIDSKHFARHLERNHKNKKEIIELSKLKKSDPERKKLLSLIRNEGNLEAGVRGHIIPKRRVLGQEADEDTYIVCTYCKSYLKKKYLCRHVKRCFANTETDSGRSHAVIDSFIYSACQKKYGKILNSMNLKKEVLSKMRGDKVAKEIMNDILIISWGDDLLKKTPISRNKYHLTAKMRRCANFVINMRTIDPKYKDMLSCLKPEAFDDVIEATKKMSRYDPETRTFRSGSTALQFGAYLKQIADLTMKIILRKKVLIPVGDVEICLKDLKRFKNLIETQWTTELGSLAMKDINNRTANKPKLLPLTEDIIKLKQLLDKSAEEAYVELKRKKTMEDYRVLVETTLVSTILHNRKRVGDIQYLEIESYEKQYKNDVTNNQDEFLKSLTETEKILTQHYKKINSCGKGSRTVSVLIPKETLKYYDMILSIRKTMNWFSEKNIYFFTYPKSQRWIDGTAVIRKYANKCGAKQPHLITSSRLRKHIATVTQLLALKNNEIDQLAKFMGHTPRTHEQFYKLPQDIYLTAKISKLLQMMEKGNAADFKNKSLDEIDININAELSEVETDEEDVQKESSVDCEVHSKQDKETDVTVNTVKNISGLSEDCQAIKKKKTIKDISTKVKSTKGLRKRWNESEKKLVKKAFAKNINNRVFPKKELIIKFINQHSELFGEDDYVRIRTLVVNEYNTK
ncbi:hypothetical protein RN001_013531 [Aquatica leii]|uniref:Uncharacterized protein n=1 Tax=Aquatica leii TaxID=1421715 RepID=A0AAN7S733_9COLE|nr:hypothetical protein RN001_013531 [Aquatica leii]